MVKDFFATYNPANLKTTIRVIAEQSPLGTNVALLTDEKILSNHFLLCNADSFVDCDLLKIIICIINK